RLRGPDRDRGPNDGRARLLRRQMGGAERDHPTDGGGAVTELTEMQTMLAETSETDFSDLRAFFINCTLKRSPEVSNTQGLMDISMEIMRRNGVEVECIRAVDHEIATG